MHTREERLGCGPELVDRLIEKLRTFPLRLAVMVAEELDVTADGAEAVKFALACPDEMDTDAGTERAALLLAKLTLVALVAAALRLTVHDELPGGVKLAGLHARFESTGLDDVG